MTDKAMTIRLTEEQHIELTWIAKTRGTSVSHEIRQAIARYIDQRRYDPAFQLRLQQYRQEQQEILDRLSL